jgi:hypothetical protein
MIAFCIRKIRKIDFFENVFFFKLNQGRLWLSIEIKQLGNTQGQNDANFVDG